MTLEEVGRLFDRIVDCYQNFNGNLDKMRSWQKTLEYVPYEQALQNLHEYASNPDNRFPPHPGALATKRTDADRYYEQMKNTGDTVLAEWEHLRNTATGPTEEQRRKVREILGQ